MAPTRHDLEVAIAAYWQAKEDQQAAAEAIQSTAEGRATSVRGGGHFNPVVNLLSRFFIDAGYPVDAVGATRSKVTLPGYYRPSKRWDLVVVHKGVLVAAIEIKALGGPSFGNNYNNRVEEALGNATDVSKANLSSLVGPEPPWLGYFFVVEDQEGSRRSLGDPSGEHFDAEDIWKGLSYQDRFAVTGQRLTGEGLYDAVCYLASSAEEPGPREPASQLDWRHFCAALEARLAYLSSLGYP